MKKVAAKARLFNTRLNNPDQEAEEREATKQHQVQDTARRARGNQNGHAYLAASSLVSQGASGDIAGQGTFRRSTRRQLANTGKGLSYDWWSENR